MLIQILRNQNSSLPEGTNKKDSASNFEDKERVHALVSSTIRSPSFIIDSGASRHMVSTRDSFVSLDALNSPKIVLGDDSKTESKGKARIDLAMVPSIMFCMSQVLLLISCQLSDDPY